jgi:hypothetical protein
MLPAEDRARFVTSAHPANRQLPRLCGPGLAVVLAAPLLDLGLPLGIEAVHRLLQQGGRGALHEEEAKEVHDVHGGDRRFVEVVDWPIHDCSCVQRQTHADAARSGFRDLDTYDHTGDGHGDILPWVPDGQRLLVSRHRSEIRDVGPMSCQPTIRSPGGLVETLVEQAESEPAEGNDRNRQDRHPTPLVVAASDDRRDKESQAGEPTDPSPQPRSSHEKGFARASDHVTSVVDHRGSCRPCVESVPLARFVTSARPLDVGAT